MKFTPEVQDNLVVMAFDVREGKQFRIGRIDVTGNEVTQDKVVRRVLDEYDFTPGELYDAKMAPKEGNGRLEKYVQRAASAQQVMIRPVTPEDGDPNTQGRPGGHRRGHVGDDPAGRRLQQRQRRDGPAHLSAAELRHHGPARETSGEWFTPWRTFRGAGQRFSIRLEPGTRYSQYSVNFSDPYWRDEPITFNTLGQSWKRFRESYDEDRLKGAFGFEQRLNEQWRRSIGFRAENVGVEDLDFDAPQEIRDWRGRHPVVRRPVRRGLQRGGRRVRSGRGADRSTPSTSR